MNTFKAYDETDPASIEHYGKKLIGKTFFEVCEHDEQTFPIAMRGNGSDYASKYENKSRKGGLGNLIEERYFHYKCNNDSEPDFYKAGVELKVTPYKKNRNGSISAKERLIITMIDYCAVINETFEESHLWKKSKLMLLIYYLYQKEFVDRLHYRIDYVTLFTPPPQDLKIIKHDFEVILEKIRAGKAHELSESDTLYLGAATKAATSMDATKQPCSKEPAKPRAFSFKNSYMTYVLNNYIATNKVTYEPILQDGQADSLEKYVRDKINNYKGYSIEELCNKFNIIYENKPKSLEAMLAYRILGIKGNHAEEFIKANIVVKAIRINNNNKIKEHMSFPTFKFKELVEEDWEGSQFETYLSETRFFFVIYKFDENQVLRLQGCQFWNIPYKNLQTEVRNVWEKTKEVLKNGLQVIRVKGKNYSNFPKSTENAICHVRPHAQNAKDTDELPRKSTILNGDISALQHSKECQFIAKTAHCLHEEQLDQWHYSKQCFWLNNTYILSQLDKDFLK